MTGEKTEHLVKLVDMRLEQVLRGDLRKGTRPNKVGSFLINTEAFPSITVCERNLMPKRRLAAVESVLLRLSPAKGQ